MPHSRIYRLLDANLSAQYLPLVRSKRRILRAVGVGQGATHPRAGTCAGRAPPVSTTARHRCDEMTLSSILVRNISNVLFQKAWYESMTIDSLWINAPKLVFWVSQQTELSSRGPGAYEYYLSFAAYLVAHFFMHVLVGLLIRRRMKKIIRGKV